MSLADAYAACEQLARTHYENFPVASRLLPRAMRPHVAAVYAFARIADDFADEPGLEPAARIAALDAWEAHLTGSPAPWDPGTAPMPMPPIDADRATLIFEAVHHTIAACDLPLDLFTDLLSAFKQDVTTTRYGTWTDVLDYCRRSANPVGRLVLRIAGYRAAPLDESSDALCTALQLTNFWQDLAIDWTRGRLYVPLAERDAARARDEDLDAGRVTPEWRNALARCATVTAELFERGRPVCDGVSGRLRFELRATWIAAHRVLDRLERTGFDVFSNRPSLTMRDAVPIAAGMLRWRRAGARRQWLVPTTPGAGRP